MKIEFQHMSKNYLYMCNQCNATFRFIWDAVKHEVTIEDNAGICPGKAALDKRLKKLHKE